MGLFAGRDDISRRACVGNVTIVVLVSCEVVTSGQGGDSEAVFVMVARTLYRSQPTGSQHQFTLSGVEKSSAWCADTDHGWHNFRRS